MKAALVVTSGVTTGAAVMSCGGAVAADDADADTAPRCVVEPFDAPPAGACQPSSWTVRVEGESSACGFPSSLARFGDQCERFCGPNATQCNYKPNISTVSCYAAVCVIDGRRPNKLEELVRAADVGAHLARAAYYEAASVGAFAILGTELEAHGAPKRLLASIRRAQRDEQRHARSAARLARDRGGDVRRPHIGRRRVRGLLAVALENAREGCVGESLAASLAFVQARAATDPALREHYARIADDETRHAALSFRVHHWLMPRLSPRQRTRVDAELRAGFQRARLAVPAPECARVLGLPSEVAFRAMATQLAGALATAAT